MSARRRQGGDAPPRRPALRFPLARAGIELVDRGVPAASIDPAIPRVILCDQLFRESIGADCSGPAEDAQVMSTVPAADSVRLVDRFEAASGRWVSVYRP